MLWMLDWLLALKASLPQVHIALTQWIAAYLRLDRWSLDAPVSLATRIGSRDYPANTALAFPAAEIGFTSTQAGTRCAATLRYQIKYRFSKALPYNSLPISQGEAVLNNLYLLAITAPQEIHPAILEIETPERGIDLQVARAESTNDSDWLLILNPDFRVLFNVGLADLSDLQPIPVEPVAPIYRLDIGIFRGEIGFDPNREETYTLDREFTLLDPATPPAPI